MAVRKDGRNTRERLLEAASKIFAEKGYHDATVGEICSAARTNVAAINYHFGSKEQLYAEVWRFAFDLANEAYPPEGGLGPEAPAEERLRGTIHSLVGKTVDPGRLGHVGKLLLREMVHPTEVLQQVKRDALHPLHERTHRLIQELLGPKASRRQVVFCEMSIIHQCIATGICLYRGQMPPGMQAELDLPGEELVEVITKHIAEFSLGGLRAVRKQIDGETIELRCGS